MVEFSLEEYLKNTDREVVTRDGRKVRILCADRPAKKPIVALVIKKEDVYSDVRTYFANGRFWEYGEDKDDLFFAPEKHEGWIIINKWPNGERDTNGIIYSTELDIPNKPRVGTHRVATIKIEWEE